MRQTFRHLLLTTACAVVLLGTSASDAHAHCDAMDGHVVRAAQQADYWFFETLVSVHREGEGAPYTGLKPAGAQEHPAVAAAERALASPR